MSNKPNPVALTTGMLMERAIEHNRNRKSGLGILYTDIASLASDLHRLAPACHRHAEAECNGEFRSGQRDDIYRGHEEDRKALFQELDGAITKAGERLDRRIAKLSEKLLPLALRAERTGDPRGWTLRLYTTDVGRPVPRNGFADDCWGIG